MTRAERRAFDLLCRLVEGARPSWRVEYAEDSPDRALVTIHNSHGQLLAAPLPVSVERAVADGRTVAKELVRVVDRRSSF